jgi:hypothetical protein
LKSIIGANLQTLATGLYRQRQISLPEWPQEAEGACYSSTRFQSEED